MSCTREVHASTVEIPMLQSLAKLKELFVLDTLCSRPLWKNSGCFPDLGIDVNPTFSKIKVDLSSKFLPLGDLVCPNFSEPSTEPSDDGATSSRGTKNSQNDLHRRHSYFCRKCICRAKMDPCSLLRFVFTPALGKLFTNFFGTCHDRFDQEDREERRLRSPRSDRAWRHSSFLSLGG